MTNLVFTVRILSLTSGLFIFSACNASSTAQSTSDFDKLCEIYTTIAKKYKDTNDQVLREGKLALRIQAEIPNLLDVYENVTNSRREDRYQTFKQVAEVKTKKQWDCPALETFYTSDVYGDPNN